MPRMSEEYAYKLAVCLIVLQLLALGTWLVSQIWRIYQALPG